MKGNRVEVWRSEADNQWRFRFVAANNEIITNSEGYHNKQDAIDGSKLAHPGFDVYLSENNVWVDLGTLEDVGSPDPAPVKIDESEN